MMNLGIFDMRFQEIPLKRCVHSGLGRLLLQLANMTV